MSTSFELLAFFFLGNGRKSQYSHMILERERSERDQSINDIVNTRENVELEITFCQSSVGGFKRILASSSSVFFCSIVSFRAGLYFLKRNGNRSSSYLPSAIFRLLHFFSLSSHSFPAFLHSMQEKAETESLLLLFASSSRNEKYSD